MEPNGTPNPTSQPKPMRVPLWYCPTPTRRWWQEAPGEGAEGVGGGAPAVDGRDGGGRGGVIRVKGRAWPPKRPQNELRENEGA